MKFTGTKEVLLKLRDLLFYEPEKMNY